MDRARNETRRSVSRGTHALRALAGAVALAMAGSGAGNAGVPLPPARYGTQVLGWHDFPRDEPRAHELSSLAWDGASGTLYALSTFTPAIIPVHPSRDFRQWTLGVPLEVRAPGRWDGEGLALAPGGGFYVANEAGARVYRLSADGRVVSEIALPAHYLNAHRNRSLESLTLSPSGRYLFVANEEALAGDGTLGDERAGTTVRILRHDLVTGQQHQYAYRTDPVFMPPGRGGDVGVSEMAALSETELLVLERAYVPGSGNSIRIYRASLEGAEDVLGTPRVDAHTRCVSKALVVDLAKLPDGAFPPSSAPQRSRVLDNFEGMAVGPTLPDGRRVLFLVSDDNANPGQRARVLVLALP